MTKRTIKNGDRIRLVRTDCMARAEGLRVGCVIPWNWDR